MAWWVQLLMGAAGVLISLIITFCFNGVINLPKHRKEREEAEQKKFDELAKSFHTDLDTSIKGVLDKLDELHVTDSTFRRDIDMLKADLNALKAGLQATLKNDLKLRYEHWCKRGYAPMDARDDLEKMYQAYHNLGANGVLDALRSEFLALPIVEKDNSDK